MTPHQRFHCVLARRHGELVGLWPVVSHRKLLWRYTRQLGPANGAPNDILVEAGPDTGAIAAAIWRVALAEAKPDLLHISRAPADSALRRLGASGGWVVQQEFEQIHVARTRGWADWAAFRASRKGRTRTQPEYLERRLAARGTVTMRIAGPGDPDQETLIDWLLHHKRAWAERGQIESLWLFSPESRAFLMAAIADDEAGLRPQRLFVLELDGVPVAVNLVAVQNDRATLVMNTYDAAYGKESVGTILIDRCVRWAYEQGLDFDFGPGDQGYKEYWSQGVVDRVLNLVMARTRWGLANRRMLTAARQARDLVHDFRAQPARAARKRPGVIATGAALLGGMALLATDML